MELNIHSPLPKRKDLRIGILGSGFIVNDCHLVAYRKAGFNVVAIASRNREHAAAVAERHGIPKIYDGYEQLLADPGIEVLDIAVPPNAQLELIQKACARKTVKGILAQKPLGMNYAEALAAVMDCQAAGITLAVNQNMRYDQSVRAAKTLLQNGTIGDPVFATIEMRAVPHWMDWHKNLGWLTLRIMSIHHLDTFRYWFGDPEGIYCTARSDPRTTFPHTDGICTYMLEYKNGLRCVGIDDTWAGPIKEGAPADSYIRWRIEGNNGLAMGDIGWCKDPYTTPSTIRYANKGMKVFGCPTWTESWFPDAFIGTMAQLLIALETDAEPAISGKDNLKTMALVEAAYLSAGQSRSATPDEIERTVHQARIRTHAAGGETSGASEEAFASFTPGARKILELARMVAAGFKQHWVGSEHIFLGIAELNKGIAVNVLRNLGLKIEVITMEIKTHIRNQRFETASGKLIYTPRAKKVLALAAKEAIELKHSYIGTEHILLGLLREGDNYTAQLLNKLDVNLAETRKAVLAELDPNFNSPD
jgi:predicted dehydrogenase